MNMQTVSVPTINQPWSDPRLSADPPAVLNPIRELGPVVYNQAHDEYAITTYDAVTEVLANTARFNSASLDQIIRHMFGGVTMMGVDDKERHGEVRGVWSKAFRRDTLEQRRAMIESVLDIRLTPLIQRIRSGETVDAISSAVRSIPTLVIARMLNLDPDRHDDFNRWSDAQVALVSGGFDESPRGQERVAEGQSATRDMNEHVAVEIRDRQARPSDDLISLMANADLGLSDRDLVASVTQLVVAGNETTARLMGHALVVFAQNPEQRELVRKDRSLVRPAIEELLRYETVVQWFTRRVVDDTKLAETPLPAGAVVAVMLGAANRDPARWEAPDVFDVTRPPQNHVAFGFGLHSCLGLNLSRLELECFLNRLLDEIPGWDLAEPPDYGMSFPVRGPERVVVRA